MPEIFDPPEKLPADVRPGVPLDQLAHTAQWAQTFQPSDASFAQRFRHNRDIREYGEALQAQKAADIEREAQTNAQAQSFFFRSRELELKRQEQARDMRFKDELHPLAMEARQAATGASRALELARIRTEKDRAVRTQIAAAKMARASEHTRGFEEHMNELEARGVSPDHPKYRDGFEIGRKSFPYAEKELIDGYKAALPAIVPEPTAPSEAQARLTKKDQVTEWMADRNHWQQERTAWRAAATSAKVGQDKVEANRRVKEAQEQLDRLNTIDPRGATSAPVPTASATQERTATNPATGEKLVLRNGKWQPLNP